MYEGVDEGGNECRVVCRHGGGGVCERAGWDVGRHVCELGRKCSGV